MTSLALALFRTMVLVGLLNAWAMENLRRRLKDIAPSQWEWLGDPFKVALDSIILEFRWFSFIVRRKHAQYEDRAMSTWGDIMLLCWIVATGLFIACVVLFHDDAPLAFTF